MKRTRLRRQGTRACKPAAVALFGLALIGGFASASGPTSAATSGLVAAFGFDAGSGTTIADASGAGNNGTASNTTWATSGKYGRALSFNGSTSRVTIPDAASLHLTTAMTLEAWVNKSATNAGWRDVVYKGDDNYYLSSSSSPANRPAGGGIIGGSYGEVFGSTSLATNAWTHLAVTYDGASVQLYVNGSQVASIPKQGALSTSLNPLTIGSDPLYGQYFQGMIDEVRVYNVALSAAQIQLDMATPITSTGSDTSPPSAPGTLTATASGTTQINLSWGAATDNVAVSGYRIERCQGAGCSNFSQIAAPTGTGTTYNDTGLTAGTTYRYRVRATDSAGNLGSYSNTAGTTTQAAADTTPPSAPGTLTATASGTTQINLSWGAATDNVAVSGYRIERCQGAGCSNFSQIAAPTGTGTTYNDTGLTAGTTYRYRVRATDSAGNLGSYSNTAGTTTQAAADTTPPSAPGTLTATASGTTQINLSWGAATDNVAVSGYRIERCQGAGCSNFSQIAAPTGTGTTYNDTGLTAGTTYRYRVRATDSAGNLGSYSNTAGTTTQAAADTTPPSAPGTLTATASGTTQINLSWGAATDNVAVSGYRIERCQGAGCSNFSQIAAPTGTGTTYNDTGLTAGTTYRYRVRATDSAGNLGSYSNTAGTTTQAAADTTPPSAPGTLTATASGTTQINLSWGAATDNVAVSGYRIERCQGALCTGFTPIVDVSGAATSYADSGLTPNTDYGYRILALDAAGNLGPYSNAAAATTQTPFADDFNRADGGLGAAWAAVADGAMSIASQVVVGTSATAGDVRTAETYTSDQYSQIEVTATQLSGGQWIGPAVRAQNGGQDAYLGIYFWNNGSPELRIYKRTAGAWTQLGNAYSSGPLAPSTKLRLTAVGSRISFSQDGVERIVVNDSSLTGGAPGLMSFGTATADNWAGGNATAPPPMYSIGGSVSGLGGTLVLQDNGGDDLTLTANGAFTFNTPLANGAGYNVTVKTAPSGQTCTVSNGSGTVSSANVTTVAVACSGGSGTITPGLDDFNRADGGLGAAWAAVADGAMSIASQVVVGTSATAGDVRTAETYTSDQYSQIEVTATQLSGGQWIGPAVRAQNGGQDAYLGIYFWNNGSPELRIYKRTAGAWTQLGNAYSSGPLAPSTKLRLTAVGSRISFSQDGVERIVVNDSSLTGGAPGLMSFGTATADNWAGGNATAPPPMYSIGGSVSGLGGTLVLQDNGGDDLTLTANGAFTFNTPLANGAGYNVTVKTAPSGQTCTVSNGSGTVSSANVTTVAVACSGGSGTITPGLDDFNRADGGLGAAWAAVADGAMSIASQVVVGTSATAGDVRTAETYTSDQYSQIEVTATQLSGGQWIGPAVRAQNGGQDAYLGIYFWNNGSPELRIYKRTAGAWTQLGNAYSSGPLAPSTKLRLTAVGSRISFSQDGVERIVVNDSSLTGGAPGLMSFGTATADNWAGGNATGTPPPPPPTFQVTYRSTDANGVVTYDVDSADNSYGTQTLRVLAPTNPAPGVSHNFLYLLPVEAGVGTTYGDAIETLRGLNAQNQYNLTLIEPTFGIEPWYANNPNDANVQYETFMTSDLVPWVTQNLAITGSEQNWLMGFSKSGIGGQDLILKHPNVFSLAATWDFPADMSTYDQFGSSSSNNYGTNANFQANYRLTQSFVDAHKSSFVSNNRIWIGGYEAFRTDMSDYDALLTAEGMAHTTETPTLMAHRWDSGWVPIALSALRQDSVALSLTP